MASTFVNKLVSFLDNMSIGHNDLNFVSFIEGGSKQTSNHE
jgi:hypothetical protein